jgi:hypothetical protein
MLGSSLEVQFTVPVSTSTHSLEWDGLWDIPIHHLLNPHCPGCKAYMWDLLQETPVEYWSDYTELLQYIWPEFREA